MLGTLLWLCAGFLLSPSAALGEEFKETFGSVNEPSFLEPLGMAVDQSSGDLLVIDGEANTVSRWSADGTPSEFSALGSNVIDGSETPEGEFFFGNAKAVQIAVDNSGGATDGNIYVSQKEDGVVDIFDEDGSFLGQLTEYDEGPEAEGPATPLAFPCGVAVDPAGDLYVGDFAGQVRKYQPAANPPVNGDNSANFDFEGLQPCPVAAGAGPTAGFIFPAIFGGEVAKRDSATGVKQYTIDSGPTTTLTVNPETGQLYVAIGTNVRRFDVSGESEAKLISSFTQPSEVTGIAVDGPGGKIYVARAGSGTLQVWVPGIEAQTEAASAVGATSATLDGLVNPSGVPVSECFFEWGETASYGEVAPCEDPNGEEVGEGNSFVPVHAELSGLETGTVYHFRLVAVNENEVRAEGGDEEFLTTGPAIEEAQASQVSATSARLSGLLNPRGEETSYVFEYVTEAKFQETGFAEAVSVPSPPGEIGAGGEFKEVSRQITGLTPGTAYRFRIVATNPSATGEGEARKFATFSPQPAALPDGRAYEMVSPPEKIGEPYPPEPTERLGGSCPFYVNLGCLPGRARLAEMMPMQSAPDGEAVAYAGQPFTFGLASDANEYLGRRTAAGWESEGLSSPLFRSSEGQGFKSLSADLSRGVLYQIEPALSPAAPTRGGESFANLYHWQEGDLQPLLSEEPPQRDPGFQSANKFRIFYGGANAGTALVPPFSHIVFAANDALTAETTFAPEAPEIEAGQACGLVSLSENCNLYEWEEGELRLVNVLEDNETAAAGAVIGSRGLLIKQPNADHAVSEDGSRIFWSDGAGQLYVRIDGEETKEIEAPGRFLTATPDGSKVLLGEGCLYSLAAEECEADLTEDEEGIPQGGFEGILGAAEDLSRVYFVDTEVLSGEEENDNGEAAEEGEFNLYLWEGGTTSFIGRLVEADNAVHDAPPPAFGDWQDSPSVRTAQASADGRYLAFMSKAPLSGYDNRRSGGGACFHPPFGSEACYEVFAYDAVAESLACVSCNPSGQRPLGGSNLSLFQQTSTSPFAPLPPPHNLTLDGQGRIFFESMDALVQTDTNGLVQDVYQWEPQGVGSCERAGGCVSLISSGHHGEDSIFLNTTPNGNDAFFLTRERLLGRDKDEQLDLYDARAPHVGGEAVGFPEGVTPPCGGEACAGPISSAPAQPSAGSSQFSGEGNPKAKKAKHKKHKKKKHRKKKKRRGGSR